MLFRSLNSPRDRILLDVGHQAYAHKILTGRRDQMATVKKEGGLSGFTKVSESPHDAITVGHASTSLANALGMAMARDALGQDYKVAAVIGDGSLTGGMALAALNTIGDMNRRMLIVLNDNEMSISPSVGAFSRYLSQIKLSGAWRQGKDAYDTLVGGLPVVGPTALELSQRIRKSVVSFAQPGQLFEDLGITYIGVVPGHDLKSLLETIGRALELKGPVIVHVRTQKGRGFRPAEAEIGRAHV